MMPPENTPSSPPELTEIEKRCLTLAANGRTPTDIVREFDLTTACVNDILRSAVEKLGARNIVGAIARAVRLDLL